jgi:succinate--hydroxymethylglutarate CoA-transferase
VAVTDLLTGHYAHSAILAALLQRQRTGKGGHVECTLFESQIASLVNIASNYLISGQEASRWGTEHPSIVPYQVFPTADSYLMVSAGNDSQFVTLCRVLGRDWAEDERFKTNAGRVGHRIDLISLMSDRLQEHTTKEWVERLTGQGLPFAWVSPTRRD